jgi:hypothetical protein
MVPAIAELDLPFIEIPDLFMTQKLVPVNRWTTLSHSPNQMVTDTDTISDDASKMSTAESDEVDLDSAGTGTSYSRALQRAASNLRESTRERSPSTEASSYAHATPGSRHVNPALVEFPLLLAPECVLIWNQYSDIASIEA